MGELVPRAWLQVSNALQQHQRDVEIGQLQPVVGDHVMSLSDAIGKVRSLLQAELDVDVGLARQLNDRDLQSCLEFCSLLERVFLYDGHFLRDPRVLIDLLKPLLHHNVVDPRLKFKKEFLVHSGDLSFDELWEQLQTDSILDHRLLPLLKAWSSPSHDERKEDDGVDGSGIAIGNDTINQQPNFG
jgi:hypothetical protein